MNTDVQYYDYQYLMDMLKGYASPKSKLTHMIRSGEVIRVKRGIYLPGDSKDWSVRTLANKIYGPSYISFEYALGWHGLIPEYVHVVTSACLSKNRSRFYETPVGSFSYRDIPAAVYPYGVEMIIDKKERFLLATPEKALCDTLSKIGSIASKNDLRMFLLDDLRMDESMLAAMNREDIAFLAGRYRRKALKILTKYILDL